MAATMEDDNDDSDDALVADVAAEDTNDELKEDDTKGVIVGVLSASSEDTSEVELEKKKLLTSLTAPDTALVQME